MIREGSRIALEVLGEHEDRGHNREEDVERQEQRLQWTVDAPVLAPPRDDETTARGLAARFDPPGGRVLRSLDTRSNRSAGAAHTPTTIAVRTVRLSISRHRRIV